MPEPSSRQGPAADSSLPDRADLERDALRRELDRLLAEAEPEDRAVQHRRRKQIKGLEWAIEWHDGGDDRSSFVRERIMAPIALIVMLGPSVGLVTGPSHTPLGYAIRLFLFAAIGIGTAWVVGKVTVRETEKVYRQLIDRARHEG